MRGKGDDIFKKEHQQVFKILNEIKKKRKTQVKNLKQQINNLEKENKNILERLNKIEKRTKKKKKTKKKKQKIDSKHYNHYFSVCCNSNSSSSQSTETDSIETKTYGNHSCKIESKSTLIRETLLLFT
eukprot:gb/GECH01009798.1/.p1 GENE.gb/GECH01009798.1/~~gb/GECH01009798.1/.p1  ORF type:complete len:128 (+),score=32.52 gb/GECH01009798.1/:1-384(+)